LTGGITYFRWSCNFGPASQTEGTASLDPNWKRPPPPLPDEMPKYFFYTQTSDPVVPMIEPVTLRIHCLMTGNGGPNDLFGIEKIRVMEAKIIA